MKQILKLTVLVVSLIMQLTGNAQSSAQKRVLTYFKTGIQRNASPNQNTVTITSTNVTQLLTNYGLTADSVKSAFSDFNEADTVNVEIGESSRQMDYAKVFAISLPDTSFKSSLINSLKNLSEVLYAEADGDNTTDLIPVDGQYGQQWALHNTIVPNADIHAEAAWDIFTGNPNSIIAVIDAGVDVNHNDLAAKIDGGDVGFFIQNDPVIGNFSHGSHVAGIAAAVTNNNNNNGVAGVDWQAKIHPKYVIGNGTSDAGITQAINDAVNFSQNVWTFNNSWETLPHGRYSVTVRSAFANVYRNNRVQCAAMGNNHVGAVGVDDPANFPAGINSGIIAVGATDINDGVAGFSTRGQHIDVSAPGVDILSTNFNNNYVVLSGTSMATPHVLGLASLLKGFNINLANDDIEQIIRLTADDVNATTNPGFDNQMGTGRINAQSALQSLQAPNQLFHWSATGGTIFNTTGSQQRIFLGFPGLADAAYIIKRSEVRTNVVFPNAMCSMVGAWGRGVGTTGYREENNYCFGEGVCEVVPGTLTNTGCTLRTFIYEVWSINGQYLGYFPKSANNVVFQYTVLGVPKPNSISGDNTVCSTSNNYTIPNLPTGATVTWSASPSGIATINSPNSSQTTLTKINNGFITLTATIANICGGNNIVINRQIGVGYTQILNIGYPSSTVTPNELIPMQIFIAPDSLAIGNQKLVIKRTGGGYSNTRYTGGDGAIEFSFPMTGTYSIKVYTYNDCGWSTNYYPLVFFCTNDDMFMLSPNPANTALTVKLSDETVQAGNEKSNAIGIKEIQLTDKMGTVLKRYVYSGTDKQVTMDVSSLKADIYYIRVFNGKRWQGKSFIKQ